MSQPSTTTETRSQPVVPDKVPTGEYPVSNWSRTLDASQIRIANETPTSSLTTTRTLRPLPRQMSNCEY